MSKQIDGDLVALALKGRFDVIVHGCNCYCTMGAGIAAQIKEEIPQAYAADCATRSGDLSKLGTYTSAHISAPVNLTVVNAYTQSTYRAGQRVLADYDAIRNVFALIAKDFDGLRIGYPAIGAGLAGGDWGAIYPIIKEQLHDQDHTFVRYKA